MTSGITVQFDDHDVRGMLARLSLLGHSPRPVLQVLATMGETQTRERFVTQIDPDGKPWKPSKRQLKHGGKTLTLHGILAGSITSKATNDYAEWGTNVRYARIHNFGGVIDIPARMRSVRHKIGKDGNRLTQADIGKWHFRNADKLYVFARGDDETAQVKDVMGKAYQVHMPKRQFLGVSPRDKSEMVEAIKEKLAKIAGGKE